MRIAIRSSKDYSRTILDIFKINFDVESCLFVEPINFFSDNSINDTSIISNYEFVSLYKAGKIDKIVLPELISVVNLLKIRDELLAFGVSSEDIIVFEKQYYELGVIEYDEKTKEQILDNHSFRYLKYLEFHVVDHCNLNCKNCTHFSPYVGEAVYADKEKIQQTLIKLRRFVDNVQDIRIMGGECLLNPDLGDYIKITKEIFPYCNCHIVTNGLLADRMPDKLIDIIKKYSVRVHISAYPPIFNKLDKLISGFKEKGISWYVTSPIFKFSKVVNPEIKIKYPYSTTEGRFGCDCKNLIDGKIAICPTVAYSKYADKRFGEGVVSKLAVNGIVDIDKVKSFEELDNLLKRPCELCDYCLYYRSENDCSLQEDWDIVRPDKKRKNNEIF